MVPDRRWAELETADVLSGARRIYGRIIWRPEILRREMVPDRRWAELE